MTPFELTNLNHLKWYVGDNLFGKRHNSLEPFRVELGSVRKSSVGSFRDELYKSMSRIVDTHGTKLNLYYSGGADSEVMLRVLLDLGVRPKVFTIRFSDGSNDHETNNAISFCESHGLAPVLVDHNIHQYIHEQQYMELAVKYTCSQLAYLTVMESVRLHADAPVLLGGEVYLQKHQRIGPEVYTPEEWYYIYREDEDAFTHRFSDGEGIPVINEVFTYSPGLLYSYLTDPIIAEVANNQVPGKITLLSIKKKVYEKHLGYALNAQTKYHGYESRLWTNKAVADALKVLWPEQQTARLEYHKLLESLVCE